MCDHFIWLLLDKRYHQIFSDRGKLRVGIGPGGASMESMFCTRRSSFSILQRYANIQDPGYIPLATTPIKF